MAWVTAAVYTPGWALASNRRFRGWDLGLNDQFISPMVTSPIRGGFLAPAVGVELLDDGAVVLLVDAGNEPL